MLRAFGKLEAIGVPLCWRKTLFQRALARAANSNNNSDAPQGHQLTYGEIDPTVIACIHREFYLPGVTEAVPLTFRLTNFDKEYENRSNFLFDNMTMPVRFIQGELDPGKPASDYIGLEEIKPILSIQWIADAGHFLHLENPQAVNKALQKFIAEADLVHCLLAHPPVALTFILRTLPLSTKSGDFKPPSIPVWVFKIMTLEQWNDAQRLNDFYLAMDRQDGFVHLSTVGQLSGTLARHFGLEDNVVILRIAAVNLQPALKWEAPPPDGGRLGSFPHYYDKLNPEAVQESWTVSRSSFALPLTRLDEAEIIPKMSE